VISGSISGSTLTVASTQIGAVAIGQTVAGAGVAAGTIVTAGGSGSFTVSPSPQSASGTLFTEPTAAVVTGSIVPSAASAVGGITGTALNVASVSAGGYLAVGQSVTGSGVTAGTVIVGLGTGTGRAGTYVVNLSQSVASGRALTSSGSGGIMSVTAISSGTLATGRAITGAGVAAGTVITPFSAGTGGTGAYNVGVSQTVASGYLTAPMASNTQVIQTDSQAGAVERMLTYRPGGDLVRDNHVGGTLFGYSYNAAKRLVEVTQNGTAEGEYAYDFQGQRVLRWILGSAYTAYIYDEEGHLLAEHNGHTGAASVEYTWIDDLPVEQESGGATWFVHTGQIGEVQMVTNGSGSAALWSAYVDPYGTATNIGTPSITMNMRLPGQYYQAEANSLSQNGWRDYDPSLGRYIEGDLLGFDAGQNIYAYVDGNPLNFSDWQGLRYDINLLPRGSQDYTNAESIPSTHGLCIIAAHGTPNILFGPSGQQMSPEDLILRVKGTLSCVNKPIEFVACSTGASTETSQPSFAWLLAHTLGVNVYAPSTWAWPYPGGVLVIADPIDPLAADPKPDPNSLGRWVHYSPSQ